jgi:Tfp pilus assembly protein PilX
MSAENPDEGQPEREAVHAIPPLLAAPLNSPAEQFERYVVQQQTNDERRARREMATIAGLAITGLFTLLGAVIFFFQLNQMRIATRHSDEAALTQHADTLAALRRAEDANTLAEATATRQATDTVVSLGLSKQAVDTAKNEMKLDQRAWVGVEYINPVPTTPKVGAVFAVTIGIKNTGKTPARHLVSYGRQDPIAANSQPNYSYDEVKKHFAGTLAPNAGASIPFNPLFDGATGKPLALTQDVMIDLVTAISKYLFTARSTMRIYSVILTGPPFAHGLLFRLTGYSQVVKPTTIRMTTKKARSKVAARFSTRLRRRTSGALRPLRPAMQGRPRAGLSLAATKTCFIEQRCESPPAGTRPPSRPFCGKAKRCGAVCGSAPSAGDGLRPRCLYVQFDVKKAGVLERALVAPVPVN